MKRLLVTGANGFIGRALCLKAQRRGILVKGATRSESDMPGMQNVIVGEIDDKTNWTPVLEEVDGIIHLAARVHVLHEEAGDPAKEFFRVNVAGTKHLARSAAKAGVRRFIYVSSIGVNGLKTEQRRKFTEADAPAPHDAYTTSKWEAEQELHRVALEEGIEVVIVRPPLVYGGGAPGNFARLVQALRKGVPLPLASVKNLRSLIYVGNLVDVLLTCATHPEAAGKTYLVSDGEDISTPELLRRLGVDMGHPARLMPCPPALLEMLGKVTGKSAPIERLLGSLQVDSGKIRRELDWFPPFSLQQGLHETAVWYRNPS